MKAKLLISCYRVANKIQDCDAIFLLVKCDFEFVFLAILCKLK